MLYAHRPGLLRYPRPTPLDALIKCHVDAGQVVYDESMDLGPGDLRGYCDVYVRPVVIRIDCNLRGTPDFSPTLAHELGHFALHRETDIPNDYTQVREPRRDLVTGHKILGTSHEWVEWQANRFAQALLLPRKPLKVMLMASTEMAFGVGQDNLHLNPDAPSHRECFGVIRIMAGRYAVTEQLMRYRLQDLGLLQDHRDESKAHVSQILGPRGRPILTCSVPRRQRKSTRRRATAHSTRRHRHKSLAQAL